MARKIIDIGAVGNDGTGDSIRDSFRKVNDNFRELYSSLGLGEKLTFIGLNDLSPNSYVGLNDSSTGATPLVTVNNTESGITFKQLVGGVGVTLDYSSGTEIVVNSSFAEISGDSSPQLGGNLSTQRGGVQYRILDLGTDNTPLIPLYKHEAVNKDYADSKIARAGVNAIDYSSPLQLANPAFGTMTGPLLLSRDPEPEDDITYGGLIAATKRYVDSAAFGSVANLYVATSGEDDRPGVSKIIQGRALAYAYRTLEAALKRAEELVLESREEIGPYKKVLTYNSGASECTLTSITAAPDAGSGFAGIVQMSVDTAELDIGSVNYYPGDILEIFGGTIAPGGGPCVIEVLNTVSTPGAISTFRIVSSGSYSVLPVGPVGVASRVAISAAPPEVIRTTTATFTLTYRVNGVSITNGGSGYSLVSVRIAGGGGSGAFGTAVVTAGVVSSITITDRGTGFTSIPTLVVDLPRFSIFTANFRTDFTGDVTTNTPEAIRGRDIREGLYLRGETSGALAQILAHSGELDSFGNELFDVDLKFGNFQIGEVISYGDVTKNIQISILVESGVYEENYPLKVPQNTTIVGDDFRRCIIRPKPGTSSSPWAFQKFRRDLTIDGLTTASNLYGHHYLSDSDAPVYPNIDNKGDFDAAAALLELNRSFIAEEIVRWMDYNIANAIVPFIGFEYNQRLCRRDAGLIVDAIVFDLKYGGYDRTISSALKYYESASARIAITDQLSQYLEVLDKLDSLMQSVILNDAVTPLRQSIYSQIIDPAYQSETGSGTVITALVQAIKDIIDESGPGYGSVNQPKNNDEMDVFLANDAVRWQSISCQGHGGFMLTLDPTGQILAKSPYAQECSSFSKSIDAQTFAGGMFVDGFAGNLQFKHENSITTTRLQVSNLERFPKLPASFLVNDTIFRINYVRDFVYSPEGSTATFVLDETNPFTLAAGGQTCTVSSGTPAVISRVDHRLQAGSIVVFTSTGTLPGGIIANKEYYVTGDGLANDTFNITATFGSIVKVNTTSTGTGTIRYQRIYELLMPGNRSMLSNDFTQINDLGYGVIAQNGGLVEAVSMFTYYCHISYYSLNGGQIRSVGGSSAHGNYALVAEGADPLEVPTPTTLFEDVAQRVKCYFPSPSFANTVEGLFVYVFAYDYVPNASAELEVDHNGVIYRYPVTSATTTDLPPGVARLNLSTGTGAAESDGLFAVIANGTVMTLRQNAQIILTGDLAEVAVRPSTGLKLRETENTVYRVLQFSSYVDANGPHEVLISNASPAVLSVLVTVTTIASNLCTTSQNHKLRLGDKFIPTSTDNGFTSGTTYYVIEVPEYNQFKLSLSPSGGTITLVDGTGLSIKGKKTHKMAENYTINLSAVGGTLPTGFSSGVLYFVISTGLTDVDFVLSGSRNGNPINTSSAGSGTFRMTHEGLTQTNLRENYDYVDLTLWQPGEFISSTPTGTTCTITFGSPTVVNLNSHGFNAGDVIKFTVSDGGNLPIGMPVASNYFVIAAGLGANEFRISLSPGGTAVDTTGASSGTIKVGKVTGRLGDSSFLVVPINTDIISRVGGSKFMFKGEEYIISLYEPESVTNEPFARVTLNRPLVNSLIAYEASYTIKSAVPIRSNGAVGTLTIRISLTRVTSHDLLEIGTGSYADTNYPKELYGSSVNPINEDTETDERDVGRCFYVTTDQYGNFRVGPYFKVDQGTGTVTFSASIALSNLDGIGFKRGVPVSEFSTDSAFTDNATDTVPTENATRIYIERRLGISHAGAPVSVGQLIPTVTGGFMSLDGQLGMKGSMNLNNNKIINLSDPTQPLEAVNLRSLTWDNFQDFGAGNIEAADILVFNGNANESINATVVGDVTFTLREGVDSSLNQIDVQIVPNTVINLDVKSDADIAQSKLLMTLATTRAAAPTGTARDKQAANGLASFNETQFTITDGFVTVKDNGTVITKLQQIATRTVLGNLTLGTANVSEVTFANVIDLGLAVKKNQYGSTGFLRRINNTSFAADGDYAMVEAAAGSAASPEASKLIIRDVNGDFGARVADLSQIKLDSKLSIDTTTTATGGYIQYYGWDSAGGILIQNGSLAADKKTAYWNNTHNFKTQDGLSDAPITAASVQCTLLTTGGNTTNGQITGRWTLTGTSPNESRLQATYSADLAEYYEGDKEYEVGTVLVFGGDKEVTLTNVQGDTRVAGVVSNTAAFAMYEGCPGLKNLVALQGRVPCKVVGKIKKGEMLVTSKIPGIAVAAGTDVKVGTVVGKALADYDSDHIGTIEIAVGRT